LDRMCSPPDLAQLHPMGPPELNPTNRYGARHSVGILNGEVAEALSVHCIYIQNELGRKPSRRIHRVGRFSFFPAEGQQMPRSRDLMDKVLATWAAYRRQALPSLGLTLKWFTFQMAWNTRTGCRPSRTQAALGEPRLRRTPMRSENTQITCWRLRDDNKPPGGPPPQA
jgi:hypothetical protein